MTDLDTSNHTLNTSTSKQKFSFPKTQRFRSGQKILYSLIHSAAIATMRSQTPEPVEQPHSDTATRIWECVTTDLCLPSAPTNSAHSLRKTNIKVSPSATGER